MRQRLLHSSADRLKEKYKSCKSNGRYIPDEMQIKTLESPLLSFSRVFYMYLYERKTLLLRKTFAMSLPLPKNYVLPELIFNEKTCTISK